jgi:type VII secretion integral membrane protein EccD
VIVGTDTGPHLLSADPRRISIRAGTAEADIALPPDIPVGELIPSVYDIFVDAGAALPPCPTSLHRPGQPALDLSISLSQLGIADGTLLILTPATAASSAPTVLHAAEAAEQVAHANVGLWTSAQSRLAALLIAIALAATTGLLAVPGDVGAPSLLLAAAAATAAAVVGCRVARHGRTVLMAVTTMGALITVATFVATLCDGGGSAIGVVLVVLSVGVLGVPGRLAMLISGLSGHIAPDLDPDTDGPDCGVWRSSSRAQQVLTALVVGASGSAALGGATVALGSDGQLPDFLVTGVLAMLLAVRCRVHRDLVRPSALLLAVVLCTTTLFIGLRQADPELAPWLCVAAAALVAGALWLGFASPLTAGAAPLRRGLDLLDCALVVAVIPLACWSSGLYNVIRGFTL